jgi:hypothetical protein
MPALIETISPGRGRAGELQTINGSGFGSYGSNAVRVDDGTGIVLVPGSDVTTLDDGTITFVIPAGLVRDRHIVVEVTNNEDDTAATWWFYSQLTLVELETNRLPGKKPGARESTAQSAVATPDEDPGIQEAKDWNRLATKLEMTQYDLLTALGDVAARGATGMRRVPAGADGQRYFRDGLANGGEWKTLVPETLWWGGQILAANVGVEMALVPHHDGGYPAQLFLGPVTDARELASTVSGQLILLNLHVTEDSTGTNTFINRVRILVNDVEAFDSDDLPTNEQPFLNEVDGWSFAPYLSLAVGDNLQVLVTKNNAVQTLNVIARVVIA